MLLNSVIAGLALISAVRSFSFGIWCIKERNVIGGISVIFLGVCGICLFAGAMYGIM